MHAHQDLIKFIILLLTLILQLTLKFVITNIIQYSSYSWLTNATKSASWIEDELSTALASLPEIKKVSFLN